MRANLGQQVFEHLRDKIYRTDIKPGERIGISEIAEQLGVSRSPVRDAFLMLVQEGIVEPIPGSYRVIQFDRKRITDIFAVRRALELAAVRLSVESLDRARVRHLRETWERLQDVDENDPEFLERHLQADNDLHQSIAEMANNLLLQQLLDKVISLAALIRRWQYSGGSPYQHLGSASAEHLAVLDAMLSGDPDAAVAALDELLTLAHARSLARIDTVSASIGGNGQNDRKLRQSRAAK